MQLDIETYKRHAGRVSVQDIDFDAFRTRPLDPASLRCLRYMHDVEHHTICYLRDLLVTPAHRDPEMTAFLTMWTFEEFWHGEAIAAVLAAHDEPAGRSRIAPLRAALGWKDRIAPMVHGLGSALVGASYTAVHMTLLERAEDLLDLRSLEKRHGPGRAPAAQPGPALPRGLHDRHRHVLRRGRLPGDRKSVG